MANHKATEFRERFAADAVVVATMDEFVNAPRDARTVSFLDDSTAALLDESAARLFGDDMPRPELRKIVTAVSIGPVILISTDPAPTTLAALASRSWLSHAVGEAMLDHPLAPTLLDQVFRATSTREPPRLIDWMGSEAVGRRVRLTSSRRRIDRLDRMAVYLTSKGATESVARQLREAADELLINAFYDAPVAAGAVGQQIPRTQDVSLPVESGCDLAYGRRDDLVFVRVRDPFGSLSRTKLLDALSRSARAGEAGVSKGLWGVCSTASLAVISVVNNHSTDILLGIFDGPAAAARPFAYHFLFRDGARRRFWRSADQDTSITEATQNTFVSIVLATDQDK
jgi:hypothetical protein